GSRKWVRTIGKPVLQDNRVVMVRGSMQDITDRVRLEAQLLQAQKMESVGRLAGGVAHDYNNMLSVIIGYAEMALDKVPAGNPLHEDLREILNAGKRSAEITRQLLAFARKQTVNPRVLDLNATVEGMLKMLRRLLGEDLDLTWQPAAGLWPVKIDPTQVDQILANLCVNARDAIKGVGKVTLETGNVTFDENYCADHAGFTPGDFVLLAVSDNGRGMDSETLDMIFEPFFTTKKPGRGTGLGLATVYGIVKQNNGFINAYSEPGAGTTFKIYLPRHADGIAERKKDRAPAPGMGRGETILLVEDEPTILQMSRTMLERLGYRVLAANTAAAAMALAEENAGSIDLLITDVVMPEMNGRELAGRLEAFCPNLRVLFMSGYTANVIARHGVLDKGLFFIQKPFSREQLAANVRLVLDR
ncbi:MAG: ATP-binding protein, partial [Desulfobulbaceae bacterium]